MKASGLTDRLVEPFEQLDELRSAFFRVQQFA